MLGFLAIAACQPVDETASTVAFDETALDTMIESQDAALDLMPSEFTIKFYQKILDKVYHKLDKKCYKIGGCYNYGYGGYGYGGYRGYDYYRR